MTAAVDMKHVFVFGGVTHDLQSCGELWHLDLWATKPAAGKDGVRLQTLQGY